MRFSTALFIAAVIGSMVQALWLPGAVAIVYMLLDKSEARHQ